MQYFGATFLLSGVPLEICLLERNPSSRKFTKKKKAAAWTTLYCFIYMKNSDLWWIWLLLGNIYLVALRGIYYKTGIRISSITEQLVSGSDPRANYGTYRTVYSAYAPRGQLAFWQKHDEARVKRWQDFLHRDGPPPQSVSDTFMRRVWIRE
jgi:hypothetical protein